MNQLLRKGTWVFGYLFFFLTPLLVGAQGTTTQAPLKSDLYTSIFTYIFAFANTAGYENTNIAVVFTVGIYFALALSGLIFVALFVYAGYMWFIAAGNDDQISKAKDILRTSVIGIIIIMTGYVVTVTVLKQAEKAITGNVDSPYQEF